MATKSAAGSGQSLLNAYPLFQKLILTHLHKLCFPYTKTQFIIFAVLANHDILYMSQIAQYIAASKEQATRAVAPLVEDGFVDRSVDTENRTRVLVRLTERGREYTRSLKERLCEDIEKSVDSSLTESEGQQLRGALETFSRLAEKIHE